MVRSCMRSSVIQFALASFYADCPHKCIIYESVQRQEQHSSGINDYIKNIDFIAVGKFKIGQQFMKLGSLLYVRYRHRSMKSEPGTAAKQKKYFPANKQRRQLWNSTVNRNRWV